jgi:hypothetical protein
MILIILFRHRNALFLRHLNTLLIDTETHCLGIR